MILKIYDYDFKLKNTLTKISSLIWNSRFYDTGSFELHTTDSTIKPNDIIVFNANNSIHSGIVLKVVENLNDVAVTGYDLKAFLNFRYITKDGTATGTAEKIIKDFMTAELTVGDKAIKNLTVDADSGIGDTITYNYQAKPLDEILKLICLSSEIGIAIDYDLTKITAKTIKGRDLTDKIVLSRKYRNIEDVEFIRDVLSEKNFVYYEKDGQIVSSGNSKGILRREGFTKDDVAGFLKQNAPIETLSATANDKYKFNIDYKLGDYVSVIYKDLITVKQITAVKEVFEQAKTLTIPILGNEKENPLKKIIMKG